MWAEAGAPALGLPIPPEPLATALHRLDERTWGTRDGLGARAIGELVDEVRRGGVDDYVVAGVDQVALDLPGIHYFLVFGRLALFVQVRDDSDGRDRLALAGRVQAEALRAAREGRLPAAGRLLVTDTPYGLHHWELTPSVEGDNDGLEGALEWLEVLRSSGRGGT